MVIGSKIIGTAKVIKHLSDRMNDMERRTIAGLLKGALIVKRRSMQLTPVDTGNLKGSCVTRPKNIGALPVVEIGYMAAYAVYVHEMDYNHKPPTQWKFLATALKEKEKEVLEILKTIGKI